MNLKHEILLIEDERNICNFITTTLRTQDYKVTSAGSAANGLSLAASGCPDLILLDLGLPDMDGIDVVRNIREWSRRWRRWTPAPTIISPSPSAPPS